MYKKLLYILLFSACINLQARTKAYTEVPVLIHLYAANQSDTNGFNLVTDLPQLIYKKINEGTLTLWDSPKKQIAISASALKNIEVNNRTSFANVESLFINEVWTSSRRRTEFYIVGFSFLAETENGRVSFGYVDAQEAFPFLVQNNIPTNVNGPAELSYINALYSKRYDFSLIQFGNKDFTKDLSLAQKIKKEAFFSKKKIIGLQPLPQTKMLSYVLEKNLQNPNDPASAMLNSIENFLNESKEIFFEIGGSKYYDFEKYKSEITITRIEITEIWEKRGNLIYYRPQFVQLYANNKPLNLLSFDDIMKWHLLIKFKSMEDILTEKNYLFNIFKCNNTMIPPNEAPFYYKALKEYQWTQVSNYVRFTKN
ncbi:MAG: hypothetical protein PSX81_07515 [bacterium]|nr:hypothetical protein [bacterium]